ncbi:MAG: leucine-rich repeat protein [Prevotella sp.]|nr:leucine-rich repeat protein [Prevotella sp.]
MIISKKNILILLSTLLPSAAMWAAVGGTFNANATLNDNSTVPMSFKILTEESGNNTVAVNGTSNPFLGSLPAVDQATVGSISIPSEVTYNSITYTVKEVGNKAFANCTKLTGVVLPNTIITIGNEAFNSCTGIATITLGGKETAIGELAFYNCYSLTSITLPTTLTTLGASAFKYCI